MFIRLDISADTPSREDPLRRESRLLFVVGHVTRALLVSILGAEGGRGAPDCIGFDRVPVARIGPCDSYDIPVVIFDARTQARYDHAHRADLDAMANDLSTFLKVRIGSAGSNRKAASGDGRSA